MAATKPSMDYSREQLVHRLLGRERHGISRPKRTSGQLQHKWVLIKANEIRDTLIDFEHTDALDGIGNCACSCGKHH